MPTPEALRKLRAVLAQLYPSKASAVRLVEDSGIPIAAVALQERPLDTWHEILKEVQKYDRLPLLLEIIGEEYGANPDFRSVRELFHNQLIPQPAPTAPDVAGWRLVHPYPMPPHFSGRVSERRILSNWLEQDTEHPLLQMRALGGFGKSALTWYWLTHDVAPAHWPRVLWWSFYESDSSFENFLRETLLYLGSDPTHLTYPRQAVNLLLDHLKEPGILLILDGFERALRAYSSLSASYQGDEVIDNAYKALYLVFRTPHSAIAPISLNADDFLRRVTTLPGLRSKVLLTTRLTPYSLVGHGDILLQGCYEFELRQLHPADAVSLFRSLGVRGNRGEIESACALYGFHPLSLRLLAGLVLKDLQQPGDIRASRRFDLTGDLIQRQHHVLEQAYASLTSSRRQLLGRLACFRSPVEYKMLQAISTTPSKPTLQKPKASQSSFELVKGTSTKFSDLGQESHPVALSMTETPDFDIDLYDLLERGLAQRDARNGHFDLHPIVRRYAYDRFEEEQRRATHRQLRDYFGALDVPDQVHSLDELSPLIELYHHTVKAGQYSQAFALFRNRLSLPLYFQFCAYQLQIELLNTLLPTGETQVPYLENEAAQAWVLNALANAYSASGQPHHAVPLFERHNVIQEKLGSKKNLAIGLANLASMAQLPIGALRVAEANLRRSIALCREIGDVYYEAISHQQLGRLLSYRNVSADSANELATALEVFSEQRQVQSQGVAIAHEALRELLLMRVKSEADASLSVDVTVYYAESALKLAHEASQFHYPHERDYVRSHWLLGAAMRAKGDFDMAEQHLGEALTRCNVINLVEMEADILIDLARLRREQGQAGKALELANEALTITERCGYVLQGSDAHLLVAELALAAGNITQGRIAAQKAYNLAFCDGPPYTYYMSYTEAEALLAQLG